jgi:hypothetical protein
MRPWRRITRRNRRCQDGIGELISVLILTRNEEQDLQGYGWGRDGRMTFTSSIPLATRDSTTDVARAMGAVVHHRAFDDILPIGMLHYGVFRLKPPGSSSSALMRPAQALSEEMIRTVAVALWWADIQFAAAITSSVPG